MRVRRTLLACAALAAAAAPALASPARPALLGGGAIGPAAGTVEQPGSTLVSVQRSRGGLELSALTYARCAGEVLPLTLRARSAGQRSFDVRRRVRLPGGRRTSVRLRSTAVEERSAAGSITVDGGGCRTASTRWRVGAPAPTSPARTPRLAGAQLYVGDTGGRGSSTPHSPIVLRSSADGTALRHVLYGVGLRCRPAAGTSGFGESVGPVVLRGNGTWDAGNREVLRERDGTTTRTVTLAGRARGRELDGHLRVRIQVKAPGRRTRTCDTGTLRFRATAVPLP